MSRKDDDAPDAFLRLVQLGVAALVLWLALLAVAATYLLVEARPWATPEQVQAIEEAKCEPKYERDDWAELYKACVEKHGKRAR